MIKVTFIAHDGTETRLQGAVGDSVMSLATNAGLDGIVAECGGSMMCATCHCYVDENWADKTGECMDGEDDMLECAADEVTDFSRLSCQIQLTEVLDGLVVRLPEEQV